MWKLREVDAQETETQPTFLKKLKSSIKFQPSMHWMHQQIPDITGQGSKSVSD
jgi:hypothetical protein